MLDDTFPNPRSKHQLDSLVLLSFNLLHFLLHSLLSLGLLLVQGEVGVLQASPKPALCLLVQELRLFRSPPIGCSRSYEAQCMLPAELHDACKLCIRGSRLLQGSRSPMSGHMG